MADQPSNGQQYGPGITRIAVTGFKSLASKTDVEIRPLTVLAGANSSGKSSLMQPLLLMKQTLESSVVPAGPFLLSGPYTRYTEAKQFLSRMGIASDSSQPFSVDFDLGAEMAAGFTYATGQEKAFDVVETRGLERPDLNWSGPWRIDKDSPPDLLKSLTRWNLLASNKGLTEFSVERYKFYHCIRATGPLGVTSSLIGLWTLDPISVLNSETRKLIHVPGLRGDQYRWLYLANISAVNAFEGLFESYVPSLIDSWQESGDSKSIRELSEGLKLLGLASSVRTNKLNESQIEMLVPRTFNSGEGDLVNVADVGLAVSTVLPVLVALIQAQPGQLVYIEQPELHLHPKAQVLMAELLVRAANRGVRLIIETHSSLLLQGILTCVAKGTITPENVALHWFTRNEDGVTKVTTADLDAQGRFGDWPADFDNVEMKASNDYLDAMESKLMAS